MDRVEEARPTHGAGEILHCLRLDRMTPLPDMHGVRRKVHDPSRGTFAASGFDDDPPPGAEDNAPPRPVRPAFRLSMRSMAGTASETWAHLAHDLARRLELVGCGPRGEEVDERRDVVLPSAMP